MLQITIINKFGKFQVIVIVQENENFINILEKSLANKTSLALNTPTGLFYIGQALLEESIVQTQNIDLKTGESCGL
jgi:hypothetical protein